MSGDTAVVSGTNGDIGHAICEKLVSQGYRVVGIDLGDVGRGSYTYRKCDITDVDQIATVFASIEEQFGTVRLLINNAGVWNGKHFLDITADDYNRTFNVNARGTFFASQWVAKRLLAAGVGGNIVSISSVVGHTGCPIPDYAGSKAAVMMFTKSWAKALGPHGIRVNSIAPGTVESAMSRKLPADRRAEINASIGLRRAGLPVEIADAVAFLASEEASYMTGAVVDVNGGMY